MAKMVVIGITGGVGAGKSTILSYMKEKYHARIIMADLVAKTLMEPGGETYQEILRQFGEDLAGEDGKIDKALLARKIFQQGCGTSTINELVHPAVVQKISKMLQKERLEAEINPSDHPHLVVIEAALLFEGHADVLCDEIWYVHADSEVRIARLMEGRGYSREKCLTIMESQMSEEFFRKKCSVTIDNSGGPEEVYFQVDAQINRIDLH